MHHIQMNIHGLHKQMDTYRYGCEVTDIHGYLDIIRFLPAAMCAHIVEYTGRGLHRSLVQIL
jgi:hypothetical protein